MTWCQSTCLCKTLALKVTCPRLRDNGRPATPAHARGRGLRAELEVWGPPVRFLDVPRSACAVCASEPHFSPACRGGSHPTLQVHGKILRQSATSCTGAEPQEPGCLQRVCLSLLSFGFPAAVEQGGGGRAVQGGKWLGVHDRKWRWRRTLLCLGHAWAWEPVCSHGIVPPTCLMASLCVRMKVRCLTRLPSPLQNGPPSPTIVAPKSLGH